MKPKLRPAFLVAGFVGKGSLENRAALSMALSERLIDPNRRDKFIDRVEEALSEYRNIYRPKFDARALVIQQFRKIERLARETDESVAQLDEADRRVLVREVELRLAAARHSEPVPEGSAEMILGARLLAEAIEHFLKPKPSKKHMRPNRRSGGAPINAPELGFIHSVALAYGDLYERPSAADMGTFAVILRIILGAADIDVQIGRARLQQIIDTLPSEMARPARGPKAFGT